MKAMPRDNRSLSVVDSLRAKVKDRATITHHSNGFTVEVDATGLTALEASIIMNLAIEQANQGLVHSPPDS